MLVNMRRLVAMCATVKINVHLLPTVLGSIILCAIFYFVLL